MKKFLITVLFNEKAEAYSCSALNIQGEWSRSLNTALEALLNKLLQRGMFENVPIIPVDKEPKPAQELP